MEKTKALIKLILLALKKKLSFSVGNLLLLISILSILIMYQKGVYSNSIFQTYNEEGKIVTDLMLTLKGVYKYVYKGPDGSRKETTGEYTYWRGVVKFDNELIDSTFRANVPNPVYYSSMSEKSFVALEDKSEIVMHLKRKRFFGKRVHILSRSDRF